MRRGGLALAAALILACETATAPATPASSAPSAPAASGTRTERPDPSPLASARPGVKTRAVGPLPALFRYVALDTPLADGTHTRLWLIDLGGKRAPVVAAEWDAPASPVGGWSASADGTSVLISAQGARARVAISLVRPESGDSRVLLEDPSFALLSARISPDGSRYAFTKFPAIGGNDLGVWSAATSGSGAAALIAEPGGSTTAPPLALAWSPDNAWLALTREVGSPADHPEIRVVRVATGEELTVAPGDRVSWRARTPQLVGALSDAAGGRVYAATLSTTPVGIFELYRSKGRVIPLVAWHPSDDRYAYLLAGSTDRGSAGEVHVGVLALPGGSASPIAGSGEQRLAAQGLFSSPEWSADGTILSALASGDDARIPIVDLLTGKQLSVLCRRGGTPPADCL